MEEQTKGRLILNQTTKRNPNDIIGWYEISMIGGFIWLNLDILKNQQKFLNQSKYKIHQLDIISVIILINHSAISEQM